MSDIDYQAFRRLDLNLLVAFDALISEGSVSKAAGRLCIGQPAMSHALGRLRELFGDDILYREGSGMRPTWRALALAPRVREWLADIQSAAFVDAAFVPAKASGDFRIALNDPLEALLLPALMARLRSQSPALALSVRPIPASMQLEHLDRGNIRLAVGYFSTTRDVHETQLLHRSGFCCIYNPALLDMPEEITLASLVSQPHIHTSYTGDQPGLVDQALQQIGLQRNIVAHTASPLTIPFVVKQSPLLAVVPDLIAHLFVAHEDLRIVPVLDGQLSLPVDMVTHRRDRSNPLLRYVAEQLIASAQEVFDDSWPVFSAPAG